MTDIRRFYTLIAAVFISVCWLSCDRQKDPCLQPVRASLHIGVYKTVESDTGIVALDSLLPNVIVGVVDSPAYFMYAVKNVNKIDSVVLSPMKDSTSIFIQADSARTSVFDKDTITFYYTRNLHFISNACGYTTYYTISDLKYTVNNIDSVKLINGNVSTDANIEHVKIYY
ncbi:MAG: hypothetical protein EOP51_17295 [Sphingobacteriales bacterium]|nr:MAG: hypothetical protein EOP51_17295 [Sphingobacteriales bacterium]